LPSLALALYRKDAELEAPATRLAGIVSEAVRAALPARLAAVA